MLILISSPIINKIYKQNKHFKLNEIYAEFMFRDLWFIEKVIHRKNLFKYM